MRNIIKSTPKGRLSPYERVEASLRSRVREGHWASGQPLPGRRKLAEEYGVAVGTVQRAVARLIEDGTLSADGNLGTFVACPAERPAGAAADVADGRRNRPAGGDRAEGRAKALRIGILIDHGVPAEVVEQTENPFFGPLFDGIRSHLGRENVYVSYMYRDGRSYQQIQRASDCDGLIIIAPLAHMLWDLKALLDTEAPFVALLTSSDATPRDSELPCIDADNPDGAKQAVKHLVELGHERIGIVNLALSQTNFNDRLSGCLGAMAEAGLTVDPGHVLVSSYPWNEFFFHDYIEQWVSAMVRDGRLPSAILACDFTMTLQTMAALQRHGVRIPEDVSLVGFDDTAVAEHTSPPLTLVRQPVFQMGRRAAARLLDHLRTSRGPLSGTERLPVQLIVRRSTRAVAQPDS